MTFSLPSSSWLLKLPILSLYSTSIYHEVCELVFSEKSQSATQTREVITFLHNSLHFTPSLLSAFYTDRLSNIVELLVVVFWSGVPGTSSQTTRAKRHHLSADSLNTLYQTDYQTWLTKDESVKVLFRSLSTTPISFCGLVYQFLWRAFPNCRCCSVVVVHVSISGVTLLPCRCFSGNFR